ncbi:MAG TPA: HD domain-containing protein [Acidimicrobiales bacterium]
MAGARAARFTHLARRFVGSLRPGGPGPADERWAVDQLGPGEALLWRRMRGADRRHAVGVARRTVAALGAEASRPVVAAALLHDVGKVESGFGTLRRTAATVLGPAIGQDRARRWAGAAGVRGRFGSYLTHDELGAGMLRSAGSDPLTAAWAREHHLPPDRWTVPASVGRALKDADDD